MAESKTSRLDSAELACLKTIGYLSWARTYENGKDITDTLRADDLREMLNNPARYSARVGRSRRR